MSDGDKMLTIDECLAMMPPLWETIERSILEHIEREAVANGANAVVVRFLVEEYARALAAGRPWRLETARQMLESRATSVQ
jgi:hypothetical protein